MSDLIANMAEAQQGFLKLVADIRPELHRYCARMTGSVFDGEDVVQDSLAKAWYALAQMESAPPLRPWLFRIAHNTAMDFLRRYEHRNVDTMENLETVTDMMAVRETHGHEPDGERVEAALKVFLTLPPVQRSALALKDVLGLSLEETATAMETSVAAVKAALSRARANVSAINSHGVNNSDAGDVERLRRYALLFNAHDWDALRTLFSDETRLTLVSRFERKGQAASNYYTNYSTIAPREGLHAQVGWVDGMPTLAVFRPAESSRPSYFIQLSWQDKHLMHVRDFRYVPYIAHEAVFTPINETSNT